MGEILNHFVTYTSYIDGEHPILYYQSKDPEIYFKVKKHYRVDKCVSEKVNPFTSDWMELSKDN